MNEKLSVWYHANFPGDKMAELDPEATFSDLFKALVDRKDAYGLVGDSIVRERCFERIASVMGIEYDFVYKLWLYGTKEVLG